MYGAIIGDVVGSTYESAKLCRCREETFAREGKVKPVRMG